ncbi:uncharacterized protein LODBEIA_P15140 [Lodderomyces beijingensis]|uniref:Pre-mRNA-splicing factor CWC15 n=1 Tax=Lodderomyces beijingensis TaxID=1775926 RepID=A0ABP0ZLY1_9ASCO
MTTNHRPQLEAKKGRRLNIQGSIVHARALPQQQKLKYRSDIPKEKFTRAVQELKHEQNGTHPPPSSSLSSKKKRLLVGYASSDDEDDDHVQTRTKANDDLKKSDQIDDGSIRLDAMRDEHKLKKPKVESSDTISTSKSGAASPSVADPASDSDSDSNDDNDDDDDDAEETAALVAEINKIKQQKSSAVRERAQPKENTLAALMHRIETSKAEPEPENKNTNKPPSSNWRDTPFRFKRTSGDASTSQRDFTTETLKSKSHREFLSKFVG